LRADERMVPHDRPFFVHEGAGLSQDCLGDTDLADVVKEPRLADHVDIGRGKPERGRDTAAPGADPLGVALRVGVLRLERVGQPEERLMDGALHLLVEAPGVFGVAERLLSPPLQPTIGARQLVAGAGGYPRCHTGTCGATLSTSEMSRTGEK